MALAIVTKIFMDRSKIVAVTTGVISLILAIAYLAIVQLIDSRGVFVPAPIETIWWQLYM